MFTGIVEERGELVGLADGALAVRAARVTADAEVGDSVAVNGVCLTVTSAGAHELTADVMPETLARTALRRLAAGDPVNLERAATPATRLGGHLVQGHVDGVGTVHEVRDDGRWRVLRVAVPAELSRYLVEKGSVAVDGVSLTVVGAGDGWFTVSLIPTTCARTTLGVARPGDPVNLEVDVIAKYVERLLGARAGVGDG